MKPPAKSVVPEDRDTVYGLLCVPSTVDSIADLDNAESNKAPVSYMCPSLPVPGTYFPSVPCARTAALFTHPLIHPGTSRFNQLMLKSRL